MPLIRWWAESRWSSAYRHYLDLASNRPQGPYVRYLRNYRLQSWHDLSIELAAAYNPYDSVEASTSIPFDPYNTYFVNRETLPGIGEEEIVFDHVTVESNVSWLNRAEETIANICGGEGPGGGIENELAGNYRDAGRELARRGFLTEALRCFLNAMRLTRTPNYRFYALEAAIVLAELGAFDEAARQFVNAAEQFVRTRQFDWAADCFMHAGLAWERQGHEDSRPGLYTVRDHYDSTRCFRLAAIHYNSVGFTDEALRATAWAGTARQRWSNFVGKFLLSVQRIVWLYGTSPYHVAATMLMIWMLSATLYLFAGFTYDRYNQVTPIATYINYDWNWCGNVEGNLIHDYGRALYCAGITMCTIGYGDAKPTSASRAVAIVDGVCGLFLPGLLLITLQRRV